MKRMPLLRALLRECLTWWQKHVRKWLARPWQDAPRALWDRLPHVPHGVAR